MTVRRAAATISIGTTGRLRICSTRIFASLVTDSSGCTAAPNGQVNDLVVNTYYVDRDSTHRRRPSLAAPAGTLGIVAGAPDFMPDEEIIPGIEDMQVQFGIDLGRHGRQRAALREPSGLAALPDAAQVVSVRIWLLVRAENPEVGFRDNRTYQYADRATATGTTADLNAANAAGRAYVPADGFRRLLVSRTIQIRNALGT